MGKLMSDKINEIVSRSLSEAENERQEALHKNIDAWGSGIQVYRRFENEIGYHELMDRAAIVQYNLEGFLLEHPVAAMNEKVFSLLYLANQIMAEAYQEIGRADEARRQREKEESELSYRAGI